MINHQTVAANPNRLRGALDELVGEKPTIVTTQDYIEWTYENTVYGKIGVVIDGNDDYAEITYSGYEVSGLYDCLLGSYLNLEETLANLLHNVNKHKENVKAVTAQLWLAAFALAERKDVLPDHEFKEQFTKEGFVPRIAAYAKDCKEIPLFKLVYKYNSVRVMYADGFDTKTLEDGNDFDIHIADFDKVLPLTDVISTYDIGVLNMLPLGLRAFKTPRVIMRVMDLQIVSSVSGDISQGSPLYRRLTVPKTVKAIEYIVE